MISHYIFLKKCRQGNLNKIKEIYSKSNFSKKQLIHAANESCKFGHLNNIKWFLSVGMDTVNIKDDLFCTSCEFGKFQIAKYLYSTKVNIHCKQNLAFLKSCQNGHLNIAKWLKKCGAYIHAKNSKAFFLSVINNHQSVAKWLYKLGLSEFFYIYYAEKMFYNVCVSGHVIIHWLTTLDFKLTREQIAYLLGITCLNGRLKFTKYLLSLSSLNEHIYSELLIICCRYTRIKLAKIIYKYGGDVNYYDNTMLLEACQKGNIKIIQWLCENGANIFFDDFLPIMYCCYFNHFSALKWIFLYLTNKNLLLNEITFIMERSFRICCSYGYLTIAKWLYDKFKNHLSEITYNDIFLDCCSIGNLNVLKWLSTLELRNSIDYDIVSICAAVCEKTHALKFINSTISIDHTQCIKLFAISYLMGKLKTLKWLRQNFTIEQEHFCNALDVSIITKNISLFKWLINIGVDISKKNDYIFRVCCVHQNIKFAKIMTKYHKNYVVQIKNKKIIKIRINNEKFNLSDDLFKILNCKIKTCIL